jgi:hypothetical protein
MDILEAAEKGYVNSLYYYYDPEKCVMRSEFTEDGICFYIKYSKEHERIADNNSRLVGDILKGHFTRITKDEYFGF